MRAIAFLIAVISNILSLPFPDCGINYIKPDNIQNASRIVGGYEAVPGSWPWAAYLKWRGEYTCGGTLLADQWVLSAGHCFYGREEPGDWEIVMGEHDDTEEEGWEQFMRVEKIILHPQYSPPGELEHSDHDLTLVKLASPVRLNDHVAPACFPEETDNLEETFPPEMTCIVTGWGATDPEWLVRGPVLKQSYAQLYSMEQCRQWIDPDWLTDRMLCAGYRLTGSEDPERCLTLGLRDSGSSLVCRVRGRWHQLGAVSWVEHCREDRVTPGVYASTISMRQWVVDTMEDNQ